MSDVKEKSTSKGVVKLTPKQEKFCQLYIELGNASEAYRQSYDCSKMASKTINEVAARMLTNCKIAQGWKNYNENTDNAITLQSIKLSQTCKKFVIFVWGVNLS